MSASFEAVLRPGWRMWLSTAFFAVVLLIDVAIVVVVCLYMSKAGRDWFHWIAAGLLIVALVFVVVRGVQRFALSVRFFLCLPYPVMLSVDERRVRIMSGLDRSALYADVSWEDIVAVVVSRAGPGGLLSKVGCVQFVPGAPASLELQATKGSVGWKVRNLGIDPAVAPLIWLVQPGTSPGLPEALIQIRRLAPDRVRFVDSYSPDSADGVDLKDA